MTRQRARYILGTGHALPERVVASGELDARLGKPAGWIERRTGIRERRFEAQGHGVSRLAVRAGHQALEAAACPATDVGCVILATSTPDHPLPPSAPKVAAELGIHGGAFDIAGACAGFVQALLTAEGLLCAQPHMRAVLVLGANLLSRRLSLGDPATAALFADGAGALVLRRDDERGRSRLLGGHLLSAGELAELITVPAGGSRQPVSAEAVERGETVMRMHDGAGLLRHAVRAMLEAAKAALAEARLEQAQLDWLVPHQANARVLGKLADALGMPRERVLSSLATVGNTSAATVPIALDHAVRQGTLQAGERVMLTAAGAGLTAAAAVLEW